MKSNSAESQTEQIYNYLLLGCKLTGLEALKLFGTAYLPARINDIKNEYNVVASRKRIKTKTGKYVNQYWIENKIKL